jgi:carbon monoxide dehydrogenase subunit G
MPIRFQIEESFTARPDRVFLALTDLEAAKEWMPGFVRIERLSDSGFHVGTEWRETRRLFGREATEQFEVTRCDPPSRIGIRVDGAKGSSKRGEFLFDYRLEPRGGGTLVTLDGEIRGIGGIFGLLGKVMVGPYKKAIAKDLRALKEHLERRA